MLNEWVTPTRKVPRRSPSRSATAARPVSTSRKARIAWRRKTTPASVSRTDRPFRSNSGAPSIRSSSMIWSESVGCETCERLGSPGEVEGVGHGQEVAEVAKLHGRGPRSIVRRYRSDNNKELDQSQARPYRVYLSRSESDRPGIVGSPTPRSPASPGDAR